VGAETKIYYAGEGQQQFNLPKSLSCIWESRVVRQSPASKDVNTEAEEYPLLRAAPYQRQLKLHQTGT
jgi:hypothetical protein